MKVLWFSWKDKKHPLAGGAETVTDNILSRLAKDGHEVILLTSRPPGTEAQELFNGYRIIRGGNRYSVYLQAKRYYKKHLQNWPDKVIEEVNTIPFFTRYYVKGPTTLMFHQLAREVWFFQMSWPLSRVGYWLEPFYLRLLNRQAVITVSQSTKNDLVKTAGFSPKNIKIIREGIELKPVKALNKVKKFPNPTLLVLGAIRPMKRTADVVKAFELSKDRVPNLKLVIAGDDSDPYGREVSELADNSPYRNDISILGKVTLDKKKELMQRSHVLAASSVKEGWGLIVTEANSQGTPVVAYDVDGLRDSVKNNKTGYITTPNPRELSGGIVKLLSNEASYNSIRQAAWQDSKQYTLDNLYEDFLAALESSQR